MAQPGRRNAISATAQSFRRYATFSTNNIEVRNSIALFCCLTFYSTLGFSQWLEGEWKGYYDTNQNGSGANLIYPFKQKISIDLKFTLNRDSSYTIYSFTKDIPYKLADTTVVCKMIGFVRGDSLFLQEVSNVSPVDYYPIGFQTMELRFRVRRKNLELRGIWKSDQGQSGTVYFYKPRSDL